MNLLNMLNLKFLSKIILMKGSLSYCIRGSIDDFDGIYTDDSDEECDYKDKGLPRLILDDCKKISDRDEGEEGDDTDPGQYYRLPKTYKVVKYLA